MITFIIKSSLSLVLLYGLYWLLLRNEKLFVFNRYFLVFALVFSLIVPFIYIPINVHDSESFGRAIITLDNNIQSVTLNQENIIQGNDSNTSPGPGKSSFLSVSLILFLIYFVGLFLFLVRFLRNINLVINTIRISEKIPFKGYRIILTADNPGPHSFFKNIFLNRQDYLEGRIDNEMLNHELEHVNQLHSIDIIIIEIIKIFYWFNPTYLLYDRAIRINHEYLADHSVIRDNYNITNYAEKLFSFIPIKNIPLTSGSSHSFTKRRLLMMTKSQSRLFISRLKIATTLCMLALVILILGFKVSDKQSPDLNSLKSSSEILQNVVKGIVLNEDGKPLRLVTIVITPTGAGVQTGSDGRFALSVLPRDASLVLSCIGYKQQTLKPDFTKEMVIKMETDPNYRSEVMTADWKAKHEGPDVTISINGDDTKQSLVIIDEKETSFRGEVKLKRDDIGDLKILKGKEATDKYGEKGKYGVIEILSKKRADELGIKPPEPKATRMNPDDFPTFMGGSREMFINWVMKNIIYPPDAIRQKIHGRVSVNFTVEADGTVSNVTCVGFPDKLLKDAVMETVKKSPGWEPARNPEFRKPFQTQIFVVFGLPDKVDKDDAYTMVDKMPIYPGGDAALLKYVYDNISYPSKARNDSIQGRVIVRFVINREGFVEDAVVIRGVHPLLDSEALRVVRTLSGWEPGQQAGKPVSVYYSLPVTFSLK